MADGSGQQAQNFGVNPWLIAVSVMLATFMEVLDTAIASVALPYIAGSLSASNDEATWVLTSYLVANAVILPASNWFSLKFGRKRFLITCVIIFTVASFFCGSAPTLGFILLARVIQGAGGGGPGQSIGRQLKQLQRIGNVPRPDNRDLRVGDEIEFFLPVDQQIDEQLETFFCFT